MSDAFIIYILMKKESIIQNIHKNFNISEWKMQEKQDV